VRRDWSSLGAPEAEHAVLPRRNIFCQDALFT